MADEQITTMPPVTPAEVTPQKKSRLPIIITVIIILGLIGGGVFAFGRTESPTKTLNKSLKASRDITSFSFMATSTGQVENNTGNGMPSSTNFTSTLNGSIDFSSLDALLLDLSLGVNASTNATTGAGSLVVGVDVRSVSKNLYLNLRNFNVSYTSTDPKAAEAQMVLMMANGFASSLQNKWVQLDATTTKATSTIINMLSVEDKEELRDYLYSMSYVTSVNKVGSENVNDVPTNHLKVTMQHGQELLDIIKKIALKQPEAKEDESFNEFMGEISKIVTQKVDLDIWIGKSDSFVYKMSSSPVVITNETTGTKTTTSQEMVFSNYNKPVSITAPADAVPFAQLMQSLLGGMMGGDM